MPVPLAPYPSPPVPATYTPPANGTQSKLECSGCRNLLLYPAGATLVCVPSAMPSLPSLLPVTSMAFIAQTGPELCITQLNFKSLHLGLCGRVTGTEMAQLVCGGCHTLLMYIRGATSVQCSCCHTVNLALEANQVSHVNCGNCRKLLMHQYGARSVKCAVCNFITSGGASTSTTEQKFNG